MCKHKTKAHIFSVPCFSNSTLRLQSLWSKKQTELKKKLHKFKLVFTLPLSEKKSLKRAQNTHPDMCMCINNTKFWDLLHCKSESHCLSGHMFLWNTSLTYTTMYTRQYDGGALALPHPKPRQSFIRYFQTIKRPLRP